MNHVKKSFLLAIITIISTQLVSAERSPEEQLAFAKEHFITIPHEKMHTKGKEIAPSIARIVKYGGASAGALFAAAYVDASLNDSDSLRKKALLYSIALWVGYAISISITDIPLWLVKKYLKFAERAIQKETILPVLEKWATFQHKAPNELHPQLLFIKDEYEKAEDKVEFFKRRLPDLLTLLREEINRLSPAIR
jgi:hypothetical protein